MKTAPCKDCQKRELGCHATCERYAAYSAEWQKARAERERYRETYPDQSYELKQALNRKMKGR